MNLVIPCAGSGSRFSTAGYAAPKFLLPVGDVPMLARVVDNLDPKSQHNLITVFRYENMASIQNMFMGRNPAMAGLSVREKPEGAAATVLHARAKIDNDEELVIANSDQLVDMNIERFYEWARISSFDAAILCFEVPDDEPVKWSYAKIDAFLSYAGLPSYVLLGKVERVAEKEMLSNYATVGIYYFKKGSDFVKAAEQMMSKEIKTNGEFYVCPVYNELIEMGKSVGAYVIPYDRMWGLGTPADYERYLLENE